MNFIHNNVDKNKDSLLFQGLHEHVVVETGGWQVVCIRRRWPAARHGPTRGTERVETSSRRHSSSVKQKKIFITLTGADPGGGGRGGHDPGAKIFELAVLTYDLTFFYFLMVLIQVNILSHCSANTNRKS